MFWPYNTFAPVSYHTDKMHIHEILAAFSHNSSNRDHKNAMPGAEPWM